MEDPPTERDMDMAEEVEARSAAGQRSGKTTCVSVMAAGKQWERKQNGSGLSHENSKPVCSKGD